MKKNAFVISLKNFMFLIIFFINLTFLYIKSIYDLAFKYYIYFFLILLGLMILKVRTFKEIVFNYYLILIFILCSIINSLLNHLPHTEFFTLICFFVIYLCTVQLKLNKKFYFSFGFICLVFFFYLFIFSIQKHDILAQFIIGKDGINIINPNTIGIGIAQLFWLIIYSFSKYRVNKLIQYALSVVAIIGIWECNARGAFVFFLISLILYNYFAKKIQKNRKFGMRLIFIGILIGYFVPLLYIGLWKILGNKTLFLGKSFFTGREWIWANFFEYMSQNKKTYIIGTGNVEILFWHDSFNLHSSYLAIWAEFGVIGACIFFIFILKNIYDSYSQDNCLSNSQFALYCLFFFLILIGITETTFTYILSVSFPALTLGLLKKERLINRSFDLQ